MSEQKTIHKVFWVWEFDKEEAWLNEMAGNGWLLDGVGFCTFRFIPCEPDTYAVRLEMHDADDSYLEFMKETGAEYVGRCLKWIYFRKNLKDGAFEIFSDIDSKVAHLNRILRFMKLFFWINLVFGLVNTYGATKNSWTGAMNLCVAALFAYGIGRIKGKKEALESERVLRE